MSHVATLTTVIEDLDALKQACETLGWKFKENQTTFKWYGKWVNDFHGDRAAYKNGIKPEDYGKCIHAIEVPGCKYEVGLVKNPQGEGYTIIFDGWDKKLLEMMGGYDMPIINQEYNIAKAENHYAMYGKNVDRCIDDNGGTYLEVLI